MDCTWQGTERGNVQGSRSHVQPALEDSRRSWDGGGRCTLRWRVAAAAGAMGGVGWRGCWWLAAAAAGDCRTRHDSTSTRDALGRQAETGTKARAETQERRRRRRLHAMCRYSPPQLQRRLLSATPARAPSRRTGQPLQPAPVTRGACSCMHESRLKPSHPELCR